MSTDSHQGTHSRALPARALATAALLSGLIGVVPRAAGAQDDDEKKKAKQIESQRLPLKRSSPFVKGRSLAIPAKLPQAGGRAIPQRKLNPPKSRPKPPPRAPAPAPASTPGSSFADLKKAGGKKCKPLPPSARVNFDFKGDIKELVEVISETTCKNFILTNKVRSQKFEIVSRTPITVAEAWRAFLSALEANDFTLVQVGSYYKVIQATDGTRSPVPIYDETGRAPINDRMVTVIWKLENGGDVNAAVNYLNIFKSGKGQIHPFQATGTIIATDFGTSIDRLARILKEIDQPGVLEEVHVVDVEFASATEIADKLTQVFEPQKPGAAKTTPASRVRVRGRAKRRTPSKASAAAEEDAAQVSKILADERTNKLIIICTEEAFSQITALMRELDVPEDGTGGQIHVLRLKHADAEEMASTLSNLAQGRAGAPARPARGKTTAPAGASTAQLFQGEVKITADKATNSLVITASKSDLTSVKRVVEKLDVPRYQVFVEAVIMEVSTNRDTDLGLSWYGGVAPNINGEPSPILFGNTPSQDFSAVTTALNPATVAGVIGLGGVFRGPTLENTESFNPGGGGIPAFGVLLQALQATNDVNVISSPHLLTMDNEEAEIQVNEKRPFPSGLNLGGLGALGGLAGQAGAGALGNVGGLGLGSVSFNREDVGLTLKLKPQINDEDYVRLEIDQELSDVAGTDQVTGQVITSKRSAKTTVVVRSQDSVVIGGLVRDRETLDESKVPLLGDIPLLGWLFKRRQRVTEKVNLILVLTPYIIRTPDDFRTIFERKMQERKEFVDRFYGTTQEYRASIDWRRKQGPLSLYNQAVNREMTKAENDGPGVPGETVIRPGEEAPEGGDTSGEEMTPDAEGSGVMTPRSPDGVGKDPSSAGGFTGRDEGALAPMPSGDADGAEETPPIAPDDGGE